MVTERTGDRYTGDFWSRQAESQLAPQWDKVYNAVRGVVLGSMARGMGVSPEKEKQLAINRIFGAGGMLEDFQNTLSSQSSRVLNMPRGADNDIRSLQGNRPKGLKTDAYTVNAWQDDMNFMRSDQQDMSRAAELVGRNNQQLIKAYTDAATSLIDFIPEILKSGFDPDAIALAEYTARDKVNKSNPYYSAPQAPSSQPGVKHTFGGMYDGDEDTVEGETFIPRDDSGAPPPVVTEQPPMGMGGGNIDVGAPSGFFDDTPGAPSGSGDGSFTEPGVPGGGGFPGEPSGPAGTGYKKPKWETMQEKNRPTLPGDIYWDGQNFVIYQDGKSKRLVDMGGEMAAKAFYLREKLASVSGPKGLQGLRTLIDTQKGSATHEQYVVGDPDTLQPFQFNGQLFTPNILLNPQVTTDAEGAERLANPFEEWLDANAGQNRQKFFPDSAKSMTPTTADGAGYFAISGDLSAEETYNQLSTMPAPDWWPKGPNGEALATWPPVQWDQPAPWLEPVASFDATSFKKMQDAVLQGAFGKDALLALQGANPFEESQITTRDVNGDGISEMFIRDTAGNLRQIAAQPRTPSVSVEDQIADALASNNLARAQDLKRFRDQPTDMERFEAALEFSQRPASSFEIANIAAGNMPGGGVPAQSLNQAFADTLEGYEDTGMLTSRMLNADPELSSNAINTIAAANMGFDVPDSPERFQQAFEALIQSGFTPGDASTALGFSPGDISSLESAITPSYQRVGEGDPFLRDAFQNAFQEYDFNTLMNRDTPPSSITNRSLESETQQQTNHEAWLERQANKETARATQEQFDYETGREASENPMGVSDPFGLPPSFMQAGMPPTTTGGQRDQTVQGAFGTKDPKLADILNRFPENTPNATMGTNMPQTSEQWQDKLDAAYREERGMVHAFYNPAGGGVWKPVSAGTMQGMWEDEDDENLTREERLARERQKRGTQAGDFTQSMQSQQNRGVSGSPYQSKNQVGTSSPFMPTGARQHSGLIVPADMYNVMNREPLTSRQQVLSASNLPVASAQAQLNMTPGGMAAYQSAALSAGVPENEFKYAMGSTNPGGARSTTKKKTTRRPSYA